MVSMVKQLDKLSKILPILLLFIVQISFAQQITISGQVVEKQDQQAIEYATISAYNAKDSSLINGTITNEAGQFELDLSPTQPFYLAVQFIGYTTFTSDILDQQRSIDLGQIFLSLNNTTLDEVEVTGRAITSVHKIDKQVFDAGQFENAKGGTASDIIQNLPSVSINANGEISVRGATGFLVMLNGKPVQGNPTLFLQQIAANSIEDIEIVTAPSAKYDPDGNAGIINIKTRQSITDGTYIIANVMLGLPSIANYNNSENAQRYGADITFNYRKNKWDFSLGADYRRYDRNGRREGYVNTYINEVLTEFPSDGERSYNIFNYSGRAAVSYTPNKQHQISAGIYAGKRRKERTADILYLNQQRSLIPSSEYLGAGEYYRRFLQTGDVFQNKNAFDQLDYFNENLRIRKGDFFITSLDYAYTFENQDQLKVSGLYERTVLGGPTDNANLAFPNTQNILQLQNNNNNNPLDGYRFQLDYTTQLKELKWESGYQFRYLSHPGDFEYLDRDLDNEIWIANPLFTNSLNLTRTIHALYSQLSGKSNKLEYTVGLRLEHFDRKVEIARPDSTYLLDQWNLFPSVNLGYDLSQGWRLKAGYSRRIERTTTFKMNPFPEREHSETLEQGDPELRPEFIDLVEFGVVKNWEDNSFFATAYFRNIENVINRVNTVFNDSILNRIYTNAGTAQAFGIEAGTTIYPSKKWRIYLGGNIFSYGIEGRLFGEAINTSNTVYSINTNTDYNFTNTFSAQLAFNYLSERISAQGQDSRFYNPSLSLTKTFLDKKITVGLQWLNIDLGLWDANEQRITTEQSNFFTTTNYIYEVDIIQLNFTYQLNQPSKNVKTPDSEFGKKEF